MLKKQAGVANILFLCTDLQMPHQLLYSYLEHKSLAQQTGKKSIAIWQHTSRKVINRLLINPGLKKMSILTCLVLQTIY